MDESDTSPSPPTHRQRGRRIPSPEDALVQKANESIAIRPKKGRLTLLSRRIYNALLFHAQQQGTEARQYTLPLARLVGDAHFTSNNVSLLKEHLREMQTTLIEWNSVGQEGQRWVSTQLLGTVEIAERGSGHPVIISWTYPERVRERLLRPTRYTKILLEMGAQMRSYAAAVLFELGLQYLTSPSRLTMREDIYWWASVLTGRSDIDKVDYRYFKRDVLRTALAELDVLQSDFSLELIEHRQGRRVMELQFRVNRKSQPNLQVTEDRNTFDLGLLSRLRAIGLKDDEADQIYAKTDEGLLRSTLDHVEQRLRNSTLPSVTSPVAYLRDALRRGYAAAAALSPALEKSPEAKQAEVSASMQALRDDWDRARIKEAQEGFAQQQPDVQAQIQANFEREALISLMEPVARAWRKDGPRSRVAGPVFFRWLAQQGEGANPPTERQLLEFALLRRPSAATR